MFETVTEIATDNPVSRWQFLGEPVYRWFLFIIVFAAMLAVWRGVLGYMKSI